MYICTVSGANHVHCTCAVNYNLYLCDSAWSFIKEVIVNPRWSITGRQACGWVVIAKVLCTAQDVVVTVNDSDSSIILNVVTCCRLNYRRNILVDFYFSDQSIVCAPTRKEIDLHLRHWSVNLQYEFCFIKSIQGCWIAIDCNLVVSVCIKICVTNCRCGCSAVNLQNNFGNISSTVECESNTGFSVCIRRVHTCVFFSVNHILQVAGNPPRTRRSSNGCLTCNIVCCAFFSIYAKCEKQATNHSKCKN